MSDAYELLRAGDAPDFTQGKDPGHAFNGYGALGSEQISLNVIVLDPGATHKVPGMPDSTGHSHSDIDEVYIVTSGELTVKLDDEELTLGPLDAVRIAPEVTRATRNTSDAPVTVIMASSKMSDPMEQTQFKEGFWA